MLRRCRVPVALLVVAVAIASCSNQKTESARDLPPAADSAYAQGETLYLDGKLDEAVGVLRSVDAGSPDAGRAHNLLGIIHSQRGEPQLAKLEFEQAERLDPTLAAAHANLGFLHMDAGELTAAEAAFERAAGLDPYYVSPHRGLAELYYKQGKTEEAKTELELAEALERNARSGGGRDLQMGERLDLAQLILDEEALDNKAADPVENPKRTPPAPPKPKTKMVTESAAVASGTTVWLSLGQPLSSKTARPGDPVTARVLGDVTADGKVVIRDGAMVRGKITQVEEAGRVKGRASLAFQFTEVETVRGNLPLSASLVEGSVQAPASKARDATKIGLGAAAGAILGEIIGDNAAAGAAIGGAAGAAIVLSTKGAELVLDAGTELQVALDEPLEVTWKRQVLVD